MSRKNILSDFDPEKILIPAAAIFPVLVLCLFVLFHAKGRPAYLIGAAGSPNGTVLRGLQDWRSLNWEEKEKSVALAIAYFRNEKNCAILQSPGHYVVLANRFFQKDPSFLNGNLMTVMRVLAIQEYDFYSGVNADEQALKLLGPDLFRKNLEVRQAGGMRLRPADVKK